MVRSRSSVSSLGASSPKVEPNGSSTTPAVAGEPVITSQPKPKLVKQKQSLCEEEMEDEGRDEPTDMRDLVKRLPEFKVRDAADLGAPERLFVLINLQKKRNHELTFKFFLKQLM